MGHANSILSGADSSTELMSLTEIKKKQFPFENLVFEGCGAKGFAYAGAVKVLEKIGVLSKIKRFSGVGTGAIVASLLASGSSCSAMQQSVNEHLANLLTDNQYETNITADELLQKFGWNNGQKFLSWFGDILKRRCGNADITFQEFYKKTGKELCIVVMNLNRMQAEYFHPKTTPDAVVRRVVLMTISIPGIYQPVKFTSDESPESYYLDGGMFCNYPIHCFDGWWLSMEPNDGFLKKCQLIMDVRSLNKERFSGFNQKTLGFIMFDDYHYDICGDMQQRLDSAEFIAIPETDLGKKYKSFAQKIEHTRIMFSDFSGVMEKLREVLETAKEEKSLVLVSQLAKRLTDDNSNFSEIELEVLFGIEKNSEDCLAFFKKHFDGKDLLPPTDIINLIEKRTCYNFYNYSKLSPRANVTGLPTFLGTINNSVHENKLISIDDLSRTVGIYTGYITNNDIDLREADGLYLYRNGWNCTVAFLEQFNPRKDYETSIICP